MAAAPKTFYRGDLPALSTVVYQVSAGKTGVVTNIVATNNNPTVSMVTVKLNGFPLLAAVGLHPNGLLTMECNQPLAEGDTIEVQGNSTVASVHISGVEFS
jgi:hypothetical protein